MDFWGSFDIKNLKIGIAYNISNLSNPKNIQIFIFSSHVFVSASAFVCQVGGAAVWRSKKKIKKNYNKYFQYIALKMINLRIFVCSASLLKAQKEVLNVIFDLFN